jgi:hypothetical protein
MAATRRAAADPGGAPPSLLRGPATEFGMLDSLKDVRERLTETLEQFAERLSEAVQKAVGDASTLEVTTFVAEDMDGVKYEGGRFGGGAKLRAVTRISIDGDVQVCVPLEDGKIDEALWKVHSDAVQGAGQPRRDD